MEMLTMHRVPPVLVNIIPGNAGGFDNSETALHTFHDIEVVPLQQVLLELNEVLMNEVVVFTEPDWKTVI